jgi:Domain of unknown function (DUF3883)
MVRDARELVEPLVGTTLYTLDKHQPNEVLAITGANVIVGTKKSPEGATVPLRIIQQGLDILFSEGEVRITPDTFGRVRRSSFVGAALGMLPDVEWTDPPVWVRLKADPVSGLPSHGGGAYPAPQVAAAIDEAGVPIALEAIRERFGGYELELMPHDNPGFDVRVVSEDDAELAYIEVKSTASCMPEFFMSENERSFAEQHADRYHLVVVTGVRAEGGYRGAVHWHIGSLDHRDVQLAPRQYRGMLRARPLFAS